MEFCDFTGDSDFDFFIPNSKFSEHSLGSNESFTYLHHHCSSNVNDNYCKRGRNSRGQSYRHSESGKNSLFGQCKWDSGTEDDECFPKERCIGIETAVSDQFPPRYPKVRKPNPFGFLHEAKENTACAATKQNTTEIIDGNECWYQEAPSGPRKFILQFDKSNATAAADISDRCYAAERDRCVEFWEFVRITPELEKVIKQGKFFHKSFPTGVDHCGNPVKHKHHHHDKEIKILLKKPQPLSNTPKYEPEMEALRERNLAIHAEDKKRRGKLQKRIKQLQEQSGQKIISATKTPFDKDSSFSFKLADTTNPTMNQVFEEMEYFDEMSNNPVGTSCKFTQRQFRRCSRLPIEYDNGESAYFGEE